MSEEIHAVTGAFGFSGRCITSRLLEKGKTVIALTNSTANPFGSRVRSFPFFFNDPKALASSLKGVDILYNTYWVRFNSKQMTLEQATRNSIVLFNAAKQAGVRRIVHISITNPDINSELEYFSAKAKVEGALKECGPGYSILRPAVLFGEGGILINNIAWTLRRFPIVPVFGDGHYRMQPIYVWDLADLMVKHGEKRDNQIINAIGPETFTYRQLLQAVGNAIGHPRPTISIPPGLGYLSSKALGFLMNDVFATREEIRGLMTEHLYVDAQPVGNTALTTWMKEHSQTLGLHYASELGRRRRRI